MDRPDPEGNYAFELRTSRRSFTLILNCFETSMTYRIWNPHNKNSRRNFRANDLVCVNNVNVSMVPKMMDSGNLVCLPPWDVLLLVAESNPIPRIKIPCGLST